MSELKPRITENGIDYILVGDYYIPDLKLPEEHRPIGKYGRMLDAMLSKGQEDENGILFVCFPVTAIATVLSRSPMTVKRSLNELEIAGLIMRVRQGIGEPNRIYVLIPGKEDAALA